MNNKEKTRKMVTVAMLGAITMVLGFTPMGYIPLGLINITTMHIPVIIAAILEGPIVGGLVGFIFGLSSIANAMLRPGPISFVFYNPIISVLPRILIGIFAGIVLCYFIGKVKTKKAIEEVKTEIKENKNIEEISLIPPVNGEVKDVSQSSDQTFASKAMGDGILVNPIDEVFVAPADAKVELVFPTKHAIGLTLKDGSQILIHCGINTVTMNGEGFETYVEEGQEVKQGDKLVKMDLKKVQEAGHSTQTLIIVNEVGQGSKVIVDANSKTPIIIKKA